MTRAVAEKKYEQVRVGGHFLPPVVVGNAIVGCSAVGLNGRLEVEGDVPVTPTEIVAVELPPPLSNVNVGICL